MILHWESTGDIPHVDLLLNLKIFVVDSWSEFQLGIFQKTAALPLGLWVKTFSSVFLKDDVKRTPSMLYLMFKQHITTSTSDFLCFWNRGTLKTSKPRQVKGLKFYGFDSWGKSFLTVNTLPLFQTKVSKHAKNSQETLQKWRWMAAAAVLQRPQYIRRRRALNCPPFRWEMHFRNDDHMEKHGWYRHGFFMLKTNLEKCNKLVWCSVIWVGGGRIQFPIRSCDRMDSVYIITNAMWFGNTHVKTNLEKRNKLAWCSVMWPDGRCIQGPKRLVYMC